MTKPKFRKHADGTVTMFVGDGFANFISGLGMADLKRQGNTYVPAVMSPELEAAYRTSTWFGKIVDIPADDATREWRTWQLEKDQITKVEAEERRLGVRQKVRQAQIWQRLYGGAAIVVGGLPGANDQPVDLDRIRPGQIKFLTVVPRDEIVAGPLRRNPLDEFYGQPEYFEIRGEGAQVRIHPSRVIPFRGVQVAPLSHGQDYWGDPIWFRLEDAIKSADQSGAVLDALLQEAKVDVLRVNGMMKGMATAEYEQLMVRRFTMVAILKGMQNVMLLDKDDEWEQKQITWTGLPDVAKHILNILSGASDIPMFRLTGQNLTGLSNTGEAEQRAYYDSVRAKQNLQLRPYLDPLDNLLVRSALGAYPEETWYEWNSLYQMTDKEKAEIDKMEADTASTYALSGLIPAEALAKAVQNRMIESGRWSALESALEELPDEDEEDQRLTEEIAGLLQRAMGGQAAPSGGQEGQGEDGRQQDAEPRTLYVRRDVKNWEAIAAHYKAQGFKTTLGSDMHVTVVYSKAPVDWMQMGASWGGELTLPAGGPRMMDAFGDNGEAKVLLFAADELRWRHERAKDIGASWDHGEYQPHITVSWDPEASIEGVEPWQGEIVLGPEIFEEINPDWKSTVTEDERK